MLFGTLVNLFIALVIY